MTDRNRSEHQESENYAKESKIYPEDEQFQHQNSGPPSYQHQDSGQQYMRQNAGNPYQQ